MIISEDDTTFENNENKNSPPPLSRQPSQFTQEMPTPTQLNQLEMLTQHETPTQIVVLASQDTTTQASTQALTQASSSQ